MDNRSEIIKNLIAQGDIKNAIEDLILFSKNTRFYNDAVLISARYKKIKMTTLKGINQDKEEWNNIPNSVLLLSDEIEDIQKQNLKNKIDTKENGKALILLGIDLGGRFIVEGKSLKKKLSGIKELKISSEIILNIENASNLLSKIDMPTIIHIIDNDKRGICYIDEYGRNRLVEEEIIETASVLLSEKVILLVLSGCFNREQAVLFSKKLPVLGVDYRLSSNKSDLFFTKFYQQISENKSIKDAFETAVFFIKDKSNDELHYPELLIGNND